MHQSTASAMLSFESFTMASTADMARRKSSASKPSTMLAPTKPPPIIKNLSLSFGPDHKNPHTVIFVNAELFVRASTYIAECFSKKWVEGQLATAHMGNTQRFEWELFKDIVEEQTEHITDADWAFEAKKISKDYPIYRNHPDGPRKSIAIFRHISLLRHKQNVEDGIEDTPVANKAKFAFHRRCLALELLLGVYYFAEHFGAAGVMNVVSDEIIHQYESYYAKTGYMLLWGMPRLFKRNILGNHSQITHLVLDMMMSRMSVDTVTMATECELIPEETTKHLLDLEFKTLKNAERIPWKLNECAYHVHPDKEAGYRCNKVIDNYRNFVCWFPEDKI